MATQIFEKLSDYLSEINIVCEVGVYLPETSNVIDFIHENKKVVLVEPDPTTQIKISDYFQNQANVTLLPYAVYDYDGTIELSKANASTFISELSASPAIVNDKFEVDKHDKFTSECRKFSTIDPGNIDLLCVDIEGAEWFVLKHLISKPKVISLETHGKYYQNPHRAQINTWMTANGYEAWYMDGSDTVFTHSSFLKPTVSDKIHLFFTDLLVKVKALKRLLSYVCNLFSKKH